MAGNAYLAHLTTPQAVVEHIYGLFAEKGHRHYGEDVTELEHALQSATFAERAGEPDVLVVAALLHDYGHLMHDLGEAIAEAGIDAHHEELGAKQLAKWFPPEVVEPVRLHVTSKRYLCFKDPAYLAGLSAASVTSLGVQGGPMSAEEANEFERHPHFEHAVRMRHYDDLGKVKGMVTPTLEDFRARVEKFVQV